MSFSIFPFSFSLYLCPLLVYNSFPSFRIFAFLPRAYFHSFSCINTFTTWPFSQFSYSLNHPYLHQKEAMWSSEGSFFRLESLKRFISVAAFILLGPFNGCFSTSKHWFPDCWRPTYKCILHLYSGPCPFLLVGSLCITCYKWSTVQF